MEKSHSQKGILMTPLIQGTQNSQNHKNRKYNGGCQELEGTVTGQLLLNRYGVSVLQERVMVMKRVVVMSVQQWGCI